MHDEPNQHIQQTANRGRSHQAPMAASSARARALPRFLLPSFAWRPSPIRPTSVANFRGQIAADRSSVARNGSWRHLVASSTPQPLHWRPQSASNSCSLPRLSRTFHSTAQRPRDHHFDTLKFVQRLKDEGLSEKQAVAMMRVLSDVIEERCALQCSV